MKGERKRQEGFSRPPLQKQIRWQGGSKPYHRSYGQKRTSGQSTPKKPLKWQLTFQEPKAQIVEEPKAHISVMLSTQKCVNCQSYNAKTACFGFHSCTKTCEQSTGGGKNISLYHQLESNNPGPVGPSYGAGLPHSFQGGASSSARTSTMSVFRGTNEVFARGGNLLAGEGGSGDSGACCLGRRVLLDPLPGAQDRRSDEAGHKSKSTELLGSSPALQDGRYIHMLRDIVAQDECMACQTGSEGRLLHSTNPSGSLEVPLLRGGPGSLPIHVSTIRSILCSLGFYQSAKASRCLPKKRRGSPYRLYRLYPSDRKNAGRSSESHGCLDCSIRGSGFHSQYGEVCVDFFPADRIPGITVEYNQYVPDTPWSQDQDDSERSCSASSPGQLQRTQAGTVYWEAECCIPGSLPSPTVLSPPSAGPTRSPSQGQSELRHISLVVSGVSGGGSMVAGAPDPME